MNTQRITRSLARSDEDLRREVEAFDPFTPNRSIPRGESREETESKTYFEKGNKVIKSKIESITPTTSTEIMAAQTIPLKDALTVVPEYNGENIPLSVFLEGCDEAKEMVTNENEANLVKLIRSKLTGEARKAIYGQAFRTIEEMKDFIKSIYAPAKTVHQLLGEMGNEYQRDYETVISFANRIRDLGRCIIETQRVNTGNIDAAFKTSIENNCIECFKRGLKPEVEQRLENAGDMEHIVQNAIKAERLVEARRNLRGEDKNNIKSMHPNREFKKGTYISQVIDSEETKVGVRTISPQSLVICQYCNRTGHSADKCRNRITGINYARVVCQLCSRDGHSANQCTTSMKLGILLPLVA